MARNQYNASSSAPLGCTHRPYMPCSPCDLLEASINAIHIETCHWEQFKGHGATFILLRPIFWSGKYSIYEILMERLAILALAYCFKNPRVYFWIFNNPCHWETRVQRDLSPMVKVTRSIEDKLSQWPTFT